MNFAISIVILLFSTIALASSDAKSLPSEQDVTSIEGAFPKLTASTLAGTPLRLPQDFVGDRNLLFIAFQREQQQNVDTWLREMKRFAGFPGFKYYELPTIDRLNPLARWFIDRGMRRGIPDREARSRTVTLYLDKPSFRKALNLPDESRIYAVLIDRTGRVIWRAEGDFDEAKASSLQKALARDER